MGLSVKQQAFVTAYLGTANGNASAAARSAGYAVPGQQGYENLKKPEILAAIKRVLDERAMSAEEVIARLSDQARGIGAYLRVDEAGIVSVDVGGMHADGRAHLLKSIRETKHGQAIEFYDAQNALVQLGRYHKLFMDRADTQLTGAGGGPVRFTEVIIERARDTLHEKLERLHERTLPGPEISQIV